MGDGPASPSGRAAAPARSSECARRWALTPARRGELALVAATAVWGLTFAMVQDAVDQLPVLAFLGYRFLAACALVALVFRRRLRRLAAAGWRAGLLMGVFLTAGYVLQTFSLQHTTAS